MKRSCTPGWAVALLYAATGLAPLRADEVPTSRWTGSAGIVSNYRFRGISQTDRHGAVQAGVEFDVAGGGYVGGWGSNVSWLSDASTPAAPISSRVELDLYAGWRGRFGGDGSWDIGVIRYQYPGSYPAGFISPHTTEGYAALGWRGLTLKYSHALTSLFGVAGSTGSRYLELAWSRELAPNWQFDAHLGRQQVQHLSAAAYTDWKLGVTRRFGHGWSAALGYVDSSASRAIYTNARGHYLGGATAVLGVGWSF